MKKLYTKGKIHPSPPPISDHLSLLPAKILTLTVALSPQDREVLAYLISSSSNSNNFSGHHEENPKTTVNRRGGSSSSSGGDHLPEFCCNCFRCYMSYWVRWDKSPNRELIHEIIDAYEEGYAGSSGKKKNGKNKKAKRKENSNSTPENEKRGELKEITNHGEGEEKGEEYYDEEEKGSVKKIVSFLGERIWGVWGV